MVFLEKAIVGKTVLRPLIDQLYRCVPACRVPQLNPDVYIHSNAYYPTFHSTSLFDVNA